VRAYGGCAAQCLRLAPREPIVVLARGHGSFDFAELPLLRARLAELGGRIEDESFHERGAQLTLTVPVAHAADATTLASNLTRGRTQLTWDDA
jgi:putative IMPACT (imprinted ancient) family translation regulator